MPNFRTSSNLRLRSLAASGPFALNHSLMTECYTTHRTAKVNKKMQFGNLRIQFSGV